MTPANAPQDGDGVAADCPEEHLARQDALLVIGDVHGERHMLEPFLETARDERRHLVFLGDLTDGGHDSASVLEAVLPMVLDGRASWVRGNHDDKLARALAGNPVTIDPALATTLEQLHAPEAAVRIETFHKAWDRARLWFRWEDHVFVHGAFDPEMLATPAKDARRKGRLATLALYGQTAGTIAPGSLPERLHHWVDTIPAQRTVVVGHDVRSVAQPLWVQGAAGGQAVFLDTGASKGGRLSALRLP